MQEKEYRTAHGVPIYVYPNPALHGFYASIFIRTGSMYEPHGKEGISHLLEHCLIRNVNELYGGKMYSMLDRHGIEFNASTFSEMIQIYVSGAVERFSMGVDVLTKVFSPIVLDRTALVAEKKRVKAEIRESDDKTSLSSYTSKIVFAGTSLANSIAGTPAAVDAVSLRALEEYRQKSLSHGNIFFYLTGNVTEADVEYLTSVIDQTDIGTAAPSPTVAPVPEGFMQRPREIFVKNSDYTAVRFTFDLDMSQMTVAESDLLYDALLSGYSSRLFIEMSEERGLVYDISGNLERYRNIGTLSFFYEVKGQDAERAIALTVDVLNSMKSPEGVEPITAGYTDNAYLLYDDMRELNFTFAYDNKIMNASYASVEERRASYKAVTAERLAALASLIFRRDNLTLTMKADKKKTDRDAIEKLVSRLG